MPMVGYAFYWALCRNVSLTSSRRPFAAGLGAYIGLNVAALCAATELGLQPTLFHSANGAPLYAPFHLAQTIPTMALAHLTVAGLVELALTAGVISYVQRANLPLLRINHGAIAATDAELEPPKRLGLRWALIGLGTMFALTPLGLIAPGGAFGEDSPAGLNLQKYHLDAVPSGLRHYAGFWHRALFNGYGFTHDRHPTVAYLVSAFVGIAVIAVIAFAVLALLRVFRRSQEAGDELERVAA
jgi:cobalt/nickel transport system permease protein